MKPKHEIPWRRRNVRPPKENFLYRLWKSRAALASIFTLMGAITSFILLQGVDGLRNIRTLPSEIRQTYHSFLSWYYDDAKWSGTWSSRAEGYAEDYGQTNLPMALTVTTERGKVFGEMFNRAVCDLSPMLSPVLVEGKIFKKKMVAYAYVYVGGKKNLLYTFEVSQDRSDPVSIVRPIRDQLNLLPTEARLVQHINASDDLTPLLSNMETTIHPDLLCPESSSQYLERLIKEGELSGIQELGVGSH